MFLFMTAFQFTQLWKQSILDKHTISNKMESMDNQEMQAITYFIFKYYIKY